jgi:hypothetical protein
VAETEAAAKSFARGIRDIAFPSAARGGAASQGTFVVPKRFLAPIGGCYAPARRSPGYRLSRRNWRVALSDDTIQVEQRDSSGSGVERRARSSQRRRLAGKSLSQSRR